MANKKSTAGYGTEDSLGSRLRYVREHQKKMSAARLHEITKISKSSITRFENGERQPRAAELVKICSALSVSPTYLLYGDEAPEFGSLSTSVYDRDIESNEQFSTVVGILMTMLPRPDKTAVLQLVMTIVSAHVGADKFSELADVIFEIGAIAADKMIEQGDETIAKLFSQLEIEAISKKLA